MKALVKWGTATVLLITTAIPAMATSWDVCIDRTNVNGADTVTIRGTIRPEFTASTAPIFAAGTFSAGQRATCTTSATPVGMFFARASAVGNLPANQTVPIADLYLAEWYFRFAAGGAFSTMGPIRGVPVGTSYSQTITGEFGGRTIAPGQAVITVLSAASGVSGTAVDAFRITVP